MSKLTKNGKNLILENVIISYNHKDDNIYITSQDEDIAGEPFCISLNQSTDTEQTLRKLLFENGLINEENIGDNLPSYVEHQAYPYNNPDIFDLGVDRHGVVSWDTTANNSSHLLIGGMTGSGKTVIANNILQQCLDNSDKYEIYGIGRKFDLFRKLFDNPEYSDNLADGLSGAVTVLHKVIGEIDKRYKIMEQVGVNHIGELDKDEYSFKKVILIIDELSTVFHDKDIDKHQGKLLNMFGKNLLKVLRLGRAAGINVVLSDHMAYFRNLPTGVKENFGNKILMGKSTKEYSMYIMNSNIGSKIPSLSKVKGRGVYSFNYSEPKMFQAYVPMK